MKIFKKNVLFAVLLFLLSALGGLPSYASVSETKKLIVHLFLDTKFVGDCNHAQGIGAALVAYCRQRHICAAVKEWDVDKITDFKATVAQEGDADHIAVNIGSTGLALFADENFTNVYTIYAGHQIFDGLQNLIGKVDVIALPVHVITQDLRDKCHTTKTHLIETIGVAHNVSIEAVKTEQAQWSGEPFLQASSYIGVFLGGDAPTSDRQMRYFTSDEAVLMGQFISTEAKKSGSTVLITNGPRTGQYDFTSGKECYVHHDDSSLDVVSAGFIEKIRAHNIPYQFFDFKRGTPSAYQAMLGKLLETAGSSAYVTGDSISMISEISDLMPSTSVYVVDVGSMNESHHAFASSMYASGRIKLVLFKNQQAEIQDSQSKQAEQNHLTAAQTIAQRVMNFVLSHDKNA